MSDEQFSERNVRTVDRAYRFSLGLLTSCNTLGELQGGLTCLGKLIAEQDWRGGEHDDEVIVNVIMAGKNVDAAVLEVKQQMAEKKEVQLPLLVPPPPADQEKPLIPVTCANCGMTALLNTAQDKDRGWPEGWGETVDGKLYCSNCVCPQCKGAAVTKAGPCLFCNETGKALSNPGPQTDECPACRGDGRVPIRGTDPDQPEFEDCKVCHGSGQAAKHPAPVKA
jgi:hypothetical protein